MSDDDARRVFTALVDESFDRLMAYCRRRTPTPQDAEDAASEVLHIAWRRLDQLVAAESQMAWLFAVAYRVLSNQRRGRQRWDRLVVRVSGAVASRSEHDPATVTVARAAVEDVYTALETLRPLDRELIRLAALEELSHAEIGEILGVPTAAVRGRLYRARQRLARQVEFAARDKNRVSDTQLDDTDDGPDQREQP